MRFTIRDLLWLTVVVAMGAGWWRNDCVTAGRVARLQHELQEERKKVDLLAKEASDIDRIAIGLPQLSN